MEAMTVREADEFPVVVFGASAGGIQALSTALASLPKESPAAIALVQHRSSEPGFLAEVFSLKSGRTVRDAQQGDRLTPGSIFLAPVGSHLLINPDGTLSLSDTAKVRWTRPAADRLFESGAVSLGGRLIAVVLTGGDSDGSDGVRAVRRAGGRVIAQDEATSEMSSMPESAIGTGCVDFVLPLSEIGPKLAMLVAGGVN